MRGGVAVRRPLGVFVLAVAVPRATSLGAFVGLLGGMAAVATVASTTSISFLWHNVVGVAAVVIVGVAVSLLDRTPGRLKAQGLDPEP